MNLAETLAWVAFVVAVVHLAITVTLTVAKRRRDRTYVPTPEDVVVPALRASDQYVEMLLANQRAVLRAKTLSGLWVPQSAQRVSLRARIEALALEGEAWGHGEPADLARRLREVLADTEVPRG